MINYLHKDGMQKKRQEGKRCGVCTTCNVHTMHHTYIHTYIQTYIHSYIHTYIHTYKHTYIHTNIHTYTYTYIHTYMTYVHTFIHKYIQTYNIHTYNIFIHTYIHSLTGSSYILILGISTITAFPLFFNFPSFHTLDTSFHSQREFKILSEEFSIVHLIYILFTSLQ